MQQHLRVGGGDLAKRMFPWCRASSNILTIRVGVLLACGIKPAQSLLFIQSPVTAHTTLAWVLHCLAPVGWLERMTQYKDKAAKQGMQPSGTTAEGLVPIYNFI